MDITIRIDELAAKRLAILDADGDVERVARRILQHAEIGIYREGRTEREFITYVFGSGWESKLQGELV